MRILLAALFGLIAIPPVCAQEPQIDELASKVADAVDHTKAKKVAVFDFVGPDDNTAELGRKLADDFSAALAKSSTKFRVEERPRIRTARKRTPFLPGNVQDLDAARHLARHLKTESFIMGKLSLKDNGLFVELTLISVESGPETEDFNVVLPLTEEMRLLMGKVAQGSQSEDPPPSGTRGYSFPSCLHCPAAQFSHEAVEMKFDGRVILSAVVGEDGQAYDVRVIRALPYGLTDEAIKTVQSWRFKPATGPDGKPAAVRQIIEVYFHLY